MTIRDDEPLKAAAHGLLVGCLLPILLYNISIRKWGNILIYSSLVGFEIKNIIEHLVDTRES